MAIFFENNINTSKRPTKEMAELMMENSELLDEMLDMVVTRLNSNIILTEKFGSKNSKIEKKDLVDPNKVKSILKEIESNAEMDKSEKAKMLKSILTFFIAIVGVIPGATILATGIVLTVGLFMEVAAIIGLIFSILGSFKSSINKLVYKNKINKGIKRLNRAIEKETDEKNIKIFKNQLAVLEKAQKQF